MELETVTKKKNNEKRVDPPARSMEVGNECIGDSFLEYSIKKTYTCNIDKHFIEPSELRSQSKVKDLILPDIVDQCSSKIMTNSMFVLSTAAPVTCPAHYFDIRTNDVL